MSDAGPNERQQRLIESTEGIIVVDAGPGTGKTYAITRRYANLLAKDGVEPEDVLLVTFTENAANEMKERVVTECSYSMAALRDAPVNTFHGFCHEVLHQYGFEAPTLLGIDDRITEDTRILENEVLEKQRFREFLAGFIDGHPEYAELFQAVDDRMALLGLVKELAAKGVFPTADGWFRNGAASLDGDFEAFKSIFEEENAPVEGASGYNQSELRSTLGSYDRNACYPPEAPDQAALREGYPGIDSVWAARAFDEDRTTLKAFVHDLYLGYLEFALSRNYLNFSFLLVFAYALLCEDHSLRAEVGFEYVMVDEFQDTSEIQFKLALLLAAEPNLCVVGDWKQSIYGFNYADVDNIREFEDRIAAYKTELNTDSNRITYSVEDVERVELERNYRSTQEILAFANQALTLPATSDEDPTLDYEVRTLRANTAYSDSQLQAYTSEDEEELILDRVQSIVDNPAYEVRGADGELRPPRLEDIAVLTRTRRFGRDLQSTAQAYEIPVAYEGGVELFNTDHAKLVLAWARILADSHADRGWAVVLEHAGYTLDEVEELLASEAVPEAMRRFREELADRETIGAIATAVLDRYGYDDAYADALVEVLQTTFDTTQYNQGDIVRFIEQSHDANAVHDVEDTPGADALTVQTIHAAKGLEHPIVIVANINQYSFPSQTTDTATIQYTDPIGLRQRTLIDDAHGYPHEYDNWRHTLLDACLSLDYDEERRLLYVAMTRAEHHLLFTAGANPSPFFENLTVEPTEIVPHVEPGGPSPTEQTQLAISIPDPEIPEGHSPHSLMDDTIFEDVEDGRGREFGVQVHDFAEAYANGEPVDAGNDHERSVQSFLDSLEGELRTEEHAYLPLTVGGRSVSISGIIDLLHITDESVEIVDYKTDHSRHAEPEYRKQLSVYYHVVREIFPEHNVRCSIYWTVGGDRVEIDPLSIDEIVAFVDSAATVTGSRGAVDDRVR